MHNLKPGMGKKMMRIEIFVPVNKNLTNKCWHLTPSLTHHSSKSVLLFEQGRQCDCVVGIIL